nr:hypothetical protein [Gammaproteobacteria bacterium]
MLDLAPRSLARPTAMVAAARCTLRGLLASAVAVALADTAVAEPWLPPGDAALRADLATLADAGVLRTPITTWPIPWKAIGEQLDAIDVARLDGWALDAYRRVEARAEHEMSAGKITPYTRVSFAEDPRVIRTFDDTPREEAEVGAGFGWSNDRFAVQLNATRVWDPADGDTFRLDGSYLSADLGGWIVSAGYPERWWGPGWDGSLILSTNARPIPQIAISRARSTPFRPRWLGWVGPWSLTSFIGQLDDERDVDDTLLFGARFAFKPVPGLEVGLSRAAQWCGEGRPCDAEAFGNLLIGRDNRGVNVDEETEPGNQLAGFDARWAPFSSGIAAFYLQWIGEDSRQGGPQIGSWLRQAGVELAGPFARGDWHHRTHIEVAETICREGGVGLSNQKPRCAYEHSIYTTGYRYEGRSLGHGMDGDGRSYTIGSTLTSVEDRVWRVSLRHIEINRVDVSANLRHTLSPTPRDFSELMLMHSRALPIGELRAAVGYSRLDDAIDDRLDERSMFGWIEFVVD